MPTITNKGQEYALLGDGSADGSIARKATHVRLYVTGTVPDKAAGSATWVEASGGGYAAKAISVADWTLALEGTNQKITLADQIWVASGGAVANVAGAYITDTGGNVLAWFERATPITIISGDQLTVTGIVLRAA
jgi:hypothetical protein